MEDSSAAASTEAASSSPTSTSDIAASVIADMSADTGAGEAPVTDAAAGDSKAAKADIDPDDFDAVPAERVDSLGSKRENAIPHSRVKAMIAKREAKLIAEVAKELGISKAEAELKLEDVIGGVKERGSKLTDYEGRISQVEAVEAVMANEPERFLQMLSTLNPDYAKFIKQQQAAAGASAEAPQGADDPEPEPDYDLGNGQKTYSLDGLKKLRAWERRQGKKETESILNERLSPFEQERKQREEREQAQRARDEHRAQFQKRVERARKWPKFTDHENDIKAMVEAEHAKGNFISFEDAYMQVVIPKLAGDRTSIRQEVLAEINKAPKTTSAATTGAPKQDDNKPKTTADIARQIMAEMSGS